MTRKIQPTTLRNYVGDYPKGEAKCKRPDAHIHRAFVR